MTHCINCGRVHKDREYPKRCGGHHGCGHTMFNNPIPIITLLQPVVRFDDVGLAVAQRADNEGWALFAGHVDPGESLEAAAVREFREETGLVRQINEVKYRTSQHTITQVLTCFTLPPINFDEWKTMRLCSENIDFGVMWARDTYPLIFPLHQILVDQWFRDQNV